VEFGEIDLSFGEVLTCSSLEVVVRFLRIGSNEQSIPIDNTQSVERFTFTLSSANLDSLDTVAYQLGSPVQPEPSTFIIRFPTFTSQRHPPQESSSNHSRFPDIIQSLFT